MVTAIFIGSLATAAILLAGGFALRHRLGAGQTLAATIVTPMALLGTVLSGAYLWDGPAMVAEGSGPMGDVLPLFERRFAEWRADTRRADSFSVWVLGDSTHQSRGDEDLRMTPAIREAMIAKGVKGLRVYGIQNANCNAYEFYFLMNRLMENPPDLVIMPLNLRAFGSRWIDDSRNGYPVMERYVPWGRIWEAAGLSARGRRITTVGVALRKLDWMLFGSHAQWFLNGLKLRAEAGGTEDSDSMAPPDAFEAAPRRTRKEAEAWLAEYRRIGETTYDRRITQDHALIHVFKAIDRLASERGVGVMYYTVQTPDVRAEQIPNFTTLRWALSGEPGVRFIEMLDVIPRKDFQRLEHFTAPGMRLVAGRLLDEIVAARDDAAWRASLRGRAR